MASNSFSDKIQQWMESLKLSNDEAGSYLKVSGRTIQNWKKGTLPTQSKQDFVLKSIENYPFGIKGPDEASDSLLDNARLRQMLTPDSPLLDNVCDYLCRIALDLAIRASETAIFASYQFQLFAHSERLFPEDKAATEAVKSLLDDYIQDEMSILSDGLILFDETKYFSKNNESRILFLPGPRNENPDLSNTRLILFIDAIDGSYFFCNKRRTFGCSVISFYHLDIGFLTVVVSDIIRRRVFIKRRGMPGFVQSISESIDPARANKFSDFHFKLGPVTAILHPSKITNNDRKLERSVLNIYRNTVNRVKAYQDIIAKLGAHNPRHLVSNPGSGGICDMAIGAVDACIETEVGFRLWDASALFIISEIYDVLNPKGKKIDMTKPLLERTNYKNAKDLENYLNDEFRIKFIVAPPNLAREILKLVGKAPSMHQ